MNLADLERLCEKAMQEVFALCKGKQWRMCIPVQLDDSDTTIMAALMEMPKLIAALQAYRAYHKHGMPCTTDHTVAGCGVCTAERALAAPESREKEERGGGVPTPHIHAGDGNCDCHYVYLKTALEPSEKS